MTLSDQVRALVERLSPAAVCDECITERLGLGACEDAEQATRELTGVKGFQRSIDACIICGVRKKVIRLV